MDKRPTWHILYLIKFNEIFYFCDRIYDNNNTLNLKFLSAYFLKGYRIAKSNQPFIVYSLFCVVCSYSKHLENYHKFYFQMSLHHIKNWHSDKDDCARFPCQHGGTCTNDIGFYNCTCIPGWTGHDCHQGNIKENTFRNHSSPLRHSDSKNVILKEFKKKK